jgi:hypothetical protein
MENPIYNRLLPAPKNGGFHMDDYYIWCGSAIQGEDGKYHLFASRWRKDLGFGAQWLFNCEIVRAVSDKPEGPYQFEEVIFEPRDRSYFDALNQHNPSIKFWNGIFIISVQLTAGLSRHRERIFPLAVRLKFGIAKGLGSPPAIPFMDLGSEWTLHFWSQGRQATGIVPLQPILPQLFCQTEQLT